MAFFHADGADLLPADSGLRYVSRGVERYEGPQGDEHARDTERVYIQDGRLWIQAGLDEEEDVATHPIQACDTSHSPREPRVGQCIICSR